MTVEEKYSWEIDSQKNAIVSDTSAIKRITLWASGMSLIGHSVGQVAEKLKM